MASLPIKFTAQHQFRAWFGVIVAFIVLDAIWLGLIATQFYVDQLGHLLAEQPNLLVAGLFYLFYAVGVVYFCVHSATSQTKALLNGGLFGMLAFATYDLTNFATLRDWPLIVVVVDIAWGTLLTGAGAWMGYRCAGAKS